MSLRAETTPPLEREQFEQVFEGIADPLALAANALAKLREHGLSTYIAPSDNLAHDETGSTNQVEATVESEPDIIDVDLAKVIDIEAFRESKTADDKSSEDEQKQASANSTTNNSEVDRSVALLKSELASPDEKNMAFNELVEEFDLQLLRFARRITGSDVLAEEVMQETYIKVWKNIDQFKSGEGSSFKAWIYRVTHNTALNYIRAIRETNGEQDVDAIIDVRSITSPAPSGDPSKTAEDRETLKEKVQTMQEMIPHYQLAIRMAAEGFSYEEIANTIGRTIPAVKSVLVRARVSHAKRYNARQQPIEEEI
ncbi:MAG: RNA polymerase sigma factor [Patescibacteria group bacterium]